MIETMEIPFVVFSNLSIPAWTVVPEIKRNNSILRANKLFILSINHWQTLNAFISISKRFGDMNDKNLCSHLRNNEGCMNHLILLTNSSVAWLIS